MRVKGGRHFVDESFGCSGKWSAKGGRKRFLGTPQLSDNSYTIQRISKLIWLGSDSHLISMFVPFSYFRMSRGAVRSLLEYS